MNWRKITRTLFWLGILGLIVNIPYELLATGNYGSHAWVEELLVYFLISEVLTVVFLLIGITSFFIKEKNNG